MRKGAIANLALICMILFFFMFAAQGCRPKTVEEQPEKNLHPSFVIEKPKEGETISGPNVTVRIRVKNLKLVSPSLSSRSGEGHVHYWLDSDRQVSYEPSATFTGVPSGKHTIRVELVQSNHTPFEPPVKKVISIKIVGGTETLRTPEPTNLPYRR